MTARRVWVIGRCLRQAHDLGIKPGHADDLATAQYQRSVLPIYQATLPPPYLAEVAHLYGAAVNDMRTHDDHPAELRRSWIYLERYGLLVRNVL